MWRTQAARAGSRGGCEGVTELAGSVRNKSSSGTCTCPVSSAKKLIFLHIASRVTLVCEYREYWQECQTSGSSRDEEAGFFAHTVDLFASPLVLQFPVFLPASFQAPGAPYANRATARSAETE